MIFRTPAESREGGRTSPTRRKDRDSRAARSGLGGRVERAALQGQVEELQSNWEGQAKFEVKIYTSPSTASSPKMVIKKGARVTVLVLGPKFC